MAPPVKRKRGYNQDGYEGSNRPSPHRPDNLPLAQHGQYGQQQNQQSPSYSQNQYNGRGGRRGSRGGNRGGGYSGGHNGGGQGFQRDRGVDAGNPNAPSPTQQSRVPMGNVNTVSVTPLDAASQGHNVQAPAPRPSTPSRQSVQQLSETTKPLPPYDYEILSDQKLSSWSSSGRVAVVAAASQALETGNTFALSLLFQELLRAGSDGRIDTAEAGSTVGEILAKARPDTFDNALSLFLDTLSIITDSGVPNTGIRTLVASAGIPAALMREQLEEPLLQALGLVRQSFGRVFIRKQTSILYRQSNYNLLREETEGYSKLVTELFTTTDNEPPTGEVVEDTFENIKALIGAFDLDAGRVLDVTLDVFASLLVKHYRFFVKLLRTSSWWPQDQNQDGLHADGQSFGGLPPWGQPNHSSWLSTDEDRERLTKLKLERDRLFWNRAREVGMQAFFELGGRKLLGDREFAEHTGPPAQADDLRVSEIAETRNWISTTRTLPPLGNAVAAQLLGFKLRFYASAARDVQDTLPVNLIYLAALLIKIGFISLRDLYSHLYPADESMEGVKEKQMKEKEEREMAKRPGGGILNALARAGALADDTVPAAVSRLRDTETRAATPSRTEPVASKAGTPSVKAEDDEKEQLSEPSDQKVQLLRSLLCIGAIPESLYLLGRFAWLPDAFPDLPEHINRILHHSLSKVYEPLRPLNHRDGVRESAKLPAFDQAGVPKGELKLNESPPAKVLRWAQLDKNDTHEGIDYRFYWDDWADNVPVCDSVDDVFTLCNTLLNYSGVKIGQDSALLIKLARIGKHSLAEDISDANRSRWNDLCKRLLCPALSLTRANPGVVNEVFDLLKVFTTQVRYTVYAEWFTGQTSRNPDIAAAFDLARAETRDTLKRMSKTNMKPMARTLAKVACASPGVVFGVVLHQIENYENLIDVVVECGRYFTYMGYDVLTWSLMSTLGRAGRSRVTENGITTSSWLMSLSLFAGRIFKRYSVMNTLPIMQYVLEQLRQDNFTDLRVLREIITSMAGIAPDTDFTDAQVQAMAGGELLQAQTLRQVHDKRHESKTSAKRLMKTLVDHGLTGPLLISIAQQRQMCIFNPEQMSLKIIGENYDDIHILMSQYLDMIRNNLSTDDFDSLVPDVIALISQYGIDPSIAFTIHRKSIARAVDAYNMAHKQTMLKSSRRSSEAKSQLNGEVEISDHQGDVPDENAIPQELKAEPSGPTQAKADEEMVDVVVVGDLASSATGGTEGNTVPKVWHPVLEDLMDRLRPTLPERFDTCMSLPFFVSFWQLSLHDLMAPYKSYTDEDNRQKEKIAAINADRSDITTAGTKRKETEKKAIADFQRRLVEEMKSHLANYSHVRDRLELEKKHWFRGFTGRWKALNDSILQECFLPRLLVSPLDSYFTWKILNMLHSSGAVEFRTMFFIDRLLGEKMLTNLLFQCTAREAENLGRFLNEVFRELSTWHADRTVYEKRAFGSKRELPGFAQKVSKEGIPERFLDYEDFRRLLYKWHRNLTEALRSCLNNGEYMHIKNAIVVLRCVCRYFPAINWIGTALYNIVETLAKKENGVRPDLWVASNSLLGNLKARQKDWMLPQAFYINDAAVKTQRATSRAPSAAPRSPLPEKTASTTPITTKVAAKSLSAAAPEFAPNPASSTNGERKQSTSGKVEVEDGEVEDIEMTDVKPPPAKPLAVVATTPGPVSKEQFADLKARALASAAAKRLQSTLSVSEQKLVPEMAASVATAPLAPPPTPRSQTPANSTPQATEPASAASRSEETLPTPSARTPQPASATLNRPEMHRGTSTPGTPNRASHTLPDRPETQRGRYPPPRQHFDRPAGPPTSVFESHVNGVYDNSRLDRPNGLGAPRIDERRGLSPSRVDGPLYNERFDQSQDRHRELLRSSEQPPRQHAPEAVTRPQPHEIGHSLRDSTLNRSPVELYQRPDGRERPAPRLDHGRHFNHPGQMPPPSVMSQGPDRASARAAPILHPDDSAHPSNGRHPDFVRDDDIHGSRFEPRSNQTFPPRVDMRREDLNLTQRFPPSESRPLSRDVSTDYTPSGPRGGRSVRGGFQAEETGRPLERTQQPPFPRPVLDRANGRLSQDFSRSGQPPHQDMNYGRLKPDSGSEPSQVPPQTQPMNGRYAPERASNMTTTPAQPAQVAFDNGRATPMFAGSVREDREISIGQSAKLSEPPTPAADRPAPDLEGIHPSRLEQFGGPPRPPPLQTHTTASFAQVQNSSPSTNAPPAGPRSGHPWPAPALETPSSAPANSSPVSARGPPTGPASNLDRRQGARRFANLNETLQKGGQPINSPVGTNLDRNNGDQGRSIRGRAASSRQNSYADAPPLPSPSAQNGGPPDFDRRAQQPFPPPPQPGPTPQQMQMHVQSQFVPPPPPPGREDQLHRRDAGRGRDDRGMERDQRDPRDLREREGSGRHRASREQSRERTGRGSDRERERDKEHPGRSIRGAGGEEERERDRDGGRSSRGIGERERERERGGDGARRMREAGGEGQGLRERERDGREGGGRGGERDGRERERREHPSGGGAMGLPLSGSSRDEGGYRGRRDGAGSNMGGRMGDGRKRGWPGEEGPGGGGMDNKRIRRGGM